MADIHYMISLLGLVNLIELIFLAAGFIAVCIASTGYAELVDSYSNLITYNITLTGNADVMSFYDIDAYVTKQADQGILMVIFILTLFTFIAHIIFGLRYRFSWQRFSNGVAFLCVVYACALCGVSVVVACWEVKLRKRLTSTYLNNQYINTPNGKVKPQVGSVATAAAFGFAAGIIFLIEALIRLRRVVNKIQT